MDEFLLFLHNISHAFWNTYVQMLAQYKTKSYILFKLFNSKNKKLIHYDFLLTNALYKKNSNIVFKMLYF